MAFLTMDGNAGVEGTKNSFSKAEAAQYGTKAPPFQPAAATPTIFGQLPFPPEEGIATRSRCRIAELPWLPAVKRAFRFDDAFTSTLS